MGALAAPFEELVEGPTFETRGRTITEADVVSFSALTGDGHPQHADAAWAARSAFGERIAHPWARSEEARSADARR
jgi:acyl dehydratase